MFSQRGVMHLAHTVHDLQEVKRRGHANRLNGVDSEFLTPGADQGDRAAARHLAAARATRSSAPRSSAAAAPRATTRSPGATPAAPMRGASTSSRTARSPASARRAAGSRGSRPAAARSPATSSRWSPPATPACSPTWRASACRSRASRCRRWSRSRSSRASTRSIMSNAVHGYISQSDKGELVIGAGTDQFIVLQPARQLPHHRAHAAGDRRAVPQLLAHAHAAPVGRDRRRHAGPQPDHRQDAGREPVHQLRLGHRRLQGDARLGPRLRPHRGDRRSRTRSPPRSRSSASPAASWSTSTAPPRWRTEEQSIHGQGHPATSCRSTSTRRTFRFGRSARRRCFALGGSTSSTSTT